MSAFNEITVYDTSELYGEMGRFRCLQFADDSIQGAVDLKDRKRILLVYQRAIIYLMELNKPSFKHVFVIGHGVGTFSSHYGDKQFKVAEIDEKIVELSKLYFNYSKDDVVIGDGRQILSQSDESTYDYIILDAFNSKGTPLHLTTREFFRMASEKLAPRGALIMNLMGKSKNDRLMNAIHTTLRESYMFTKVFSCPATSEAEIRNIIVMASNAAIEFDVREMEGLYELDLAEGHIIRDSRPNEFK
ncbi:spermidine synthase [Cohnella abietis]|nr:fused MFS/spermidine synthase [Cohnella abietis]